MSSKSRGAGLLCAARAHSRPRVAASRQGIAPEGDLNLTNQRCVWSLLLPLLLPLG